MTNIALNNVSDVTKDDATVVRLSLNNKQYILIGTAHVSKLSAQEVKRVIADEQPSSVCVELDEQRYQSIKDKNKWQDMDIFKVIKEKKAALLLMNIVISSFQKKVAKQFNVTPGEEMIQAMDSAELIGAELVLADRNIQITFKRIWGHVGLKGRALLMTQLVASIFSKETMTEEELEEMKRQDTIEAILSEFTTSFPKLKTTLIDERDQYLAEKIKSAPGDKVVAVLGAAHVPGVIKAFETTQDLDVLNIVPKKSKWPKRIAFMIPVLIMMIIALTFVINPEAGTKQLVSWLLWNGVLSAIGVVVAFGHPLSALTALVVAPITSLNPLLAAGWFSGLVQAYVKKPRVIDFEALSDDVYTVKGFWSNKATRVLLVVIFANLGSTLGTIIAGTDVVRLFIENIFR